MGKSVWGNLSQHDAQQLEIIQNEAGRLVTGAIRGTSIERINSELGWPTLASRRQFLSCVTLHKLIQGHCPSYLTDITPKPLTQNPSYCLRNRTNVGRILEVQTCRSNRTSKSFIPSSTKFFNTLSCNLRELTSLTLFKQSLKVHLFPPKPPKYYSCLYQGSKTHTQLRLNMCSLNAYLHKINLTDTPKCLCGAKSETVEHFLLCCPLHAQPRRDLLHSTLPVYDKLGDKNKTLLSFLLHGSCELSLDNKQCNSFQSCWKLYHSIWAFLVHC